MRLYTVEDCDLTGDQRDLCRKVVVYAGGPLLVSVPGQLFLCAETDRRRCRQEMIDVISLADGERYLVHREDILGILKPELLPDEARLHLSQIRPFNAADLKTCEPQYFGYSFLPDGRYAAGVWLCSPEEVRDYVELQKPYQHRIRICDRDDFAVVEVLEGKVIFPDAQALEEFGKEQARNGGLTMT